MSDQAAVTSDSGTALASTGNAPLVMAASTDGYLPVAGRRFSPAVAKGCRVALGITLAFVLITMI